MPPAAMLAARQFAPPPPPPGHPSPPPSPRPTTEGAGATAEPGRAAWAFPPFTAILAGMPEIPTPVAVNTAGGSPATAADSVLGPATGPRVQLPTVATPLLA